MYQPLSLVAEARGRKRAAIRSTEMSPDVFIPQENNVTWKRNVYKKRNAGTCDYMDAIPHVWLHGYNPSRVTTWIQSLTCDYMDTIPHVWLHGYNPSRVTTWIQSLTCDYMDTIPHVWLHGYNPSRVTTWMQSLICVWIGVCENPCYLQ